MSSLELVSLYELDSTGIKPENRVTREAITVIPPSNITDYSYFLLRGAPFYVDSLEIYTGTGAGARKLVENVDYWCVVDFISASVHMKKRIACGVALFDASYSGTLYCTYQALGGNFSVPDKSVLEELIRHRYTARHVSYEQITNLPAGFAPAFHEHVLGDLTGMADVVKMLVKIEEAIRARDGSYAELHTTFHDHVNSADAHSPAEVGLGNVANFGVASATDITNGAPNKYVTAAHLKAISAQLRPQDLTGYATKVDLQSAVNQLNSAAVTAAQIERMINTSLGSYYDKTAIENKLNQAVANASVDLSNYYNKAETVSEIQRVLTNGRFATIDNVNTSINQRLNSTLSGYVTSATLASTIGNYYTKAQVDAKVRDALNTVATTESVTGLINNARTDLNNTINSSILDKSKYQVLNTNSSATTGSLRTLIGTVNDNIKDRMRHGNLYIRHTCTVNTNITVGTATNEVALDEAGASFTIFNAGNTQITFTQGGTIRVLAPKNAMSFVLSGGNGIDMIGGILGG